LIACSCLPAAAAAAGVGGFHVVAVEVGGYEKNSLQEIWCVHDHQLVLVCFATSYS